jgi:hypothetical protein
VQAVRRRMQKMRTGMQKHDEVTLYFLFSLRNRTKNKET